MLSYVVGMFAAGILANRCGWLPDIPGGVTRIWGFIALAAVVVLPLILVFAGGIENMDPFGGGPTYQSLVLCTWEAFYCVGMSVTLLSLFRRRFDRQGMVARVMSANAYGVYIIHGPIVILVAFLLRGVVLFPLLKWALVAPLAVALCFLVSEYVVRRIPLATRVL